MRYIPAAVTRTVGRGLLQTQKHSPRILFTTGIVGVVATAVLASKATLKLDETLSEIEELKDAVNGGLGAKLKSGGTYGEDDRRKDMIVLNVRAVGAVAKLYAPAIAVGAVSIGCLAGSHVILTNRNVALTAAYAGLERAYNGYRQRVEDEFGTEKELELRHGAYEREVTVENKNGKTKTVKVVDGTRSVYARFFDEYCKGWSKEAEYNRVFVQCQQNYANDLLRARGHVFLNEVYDMLGIERSKAGAVVGWVIGDGVDNFIDFGMYDASNERARSFVNSREGSVLLDFNVDGVIYDKI